MPDRGELREIAWHAVSAKEQSHQLCRYCDKRATKMRFQPIGRLRAGWVLVCTDHSAIGPERFPYGRRIKAPRADIGG